MGHQSTVSFEPIVDIDFSGLHWIEASAGSGKTFTLSSLIVRALVEKYLPRQVVATTFTRAAAAELKLRTRKRLIAALDFFSTLQGQAEQQNLDLLDDMVNQSADPLFVVLLQKYANKIGYLCARLNVVITQLDELFVGTLDSFSQKLLREFAFESGKIDRVEITDQSKLYIHQLVHDVLREWIQQQPQSHIDALYFSGHLKPVEHYIKLVSDVLNFSSAQFNPPKLPTLELAKIPELQQQLKNTSLTHLADYYTKDGLYIDGVSGGLYKPTKAKFTALFETSIPDVLQRLKTGDGQSFFSGRYDALSNLQRQINTEKLFSKKCPPAAAEAFYQDPVLRQFFTVFDRLMEIDQQLKQTEVYFRFHLCEQVKQRLPALLQYKGETTFAQQIRTLSDALQGQQGQDFAAFVHRSYPLIFVDEFQDTNQDQDNMLARIWRDSQRYAQGCMVMVGDRKQAIYGFRGGDMLTFIQAYQDVTNKQGHYYRLKYNHRTVAPLVDAVDALLQRQVDFGEGVIYQPVEAGTRAHAALVDTVGENHLPLRWLYINDKEISADIQVAWQISTLLQQAQQGALYIQQLDEKQPIEANDIAILSKSHKNLDRVQYQLERLGVRVNRPAKRSVFAGVIAQDVAAFLTAILYPYDERKVRRALTTRLIGFKVSEFMQLEASADGLGQYITAFEHIRELWFTRQFLSAWQYALNYFGIWEGIVRYQRRDNERAIVDLRHVTDLLSQHSRKYQGPQHLYQWYIKQLASPSEREWELERGLSNAAGVQLMTIHQSKGLEFKIVFLTHADASFSERGKTLNFSTAEQNDVLSQQQKIRRVVAINDETTLDQQALSQHQARAEAEQNRLWYVALTRASHRMYVVLVQPKSPSGVSLWKNASNAEFNHPSSGEQAEILSAPTPYREKDTQRIALYIQPLPRLRLYPKSRTSFSALAQHLTHQQALDFLVDGAQNQQPADDEWPSELQVQPLDASLPLLDIAQVFPKGTQAGNFLHEIFEQIDFQQRKDWPIEIHRRLKNDYVALRQPLLEFYQQQTPEQPEQALIDAMTIWLDAILSTPIHDDFYLQQLKQGEYLSELPFYLAMSDRVFATQRIVKLFQDYGLLIPALNPAESARFMNGSIDLVYQYQGKYYIADYKSNFLGDQAANYSDEHLAQNMSKSSYWLQASLYLVALHRYLKAKLKNYQIEKHLGGASYLYVRGMLGVTGYGVLHWQPEVEFILRLDSILGYYSYS